MSQPSSPETPTSCDTDLQEASIEEIRKMLSSMRALVYYLDLPQYNKSNSLEEGQKEKNREKNRYKDILPYNETRVKLKSATDYINASYVNMKISSTGTANKYICAQGPLDHTMADFWQMIWEQECTIIVMLTALVENGVSKCGKYWPDKGTTKTFSKFSISFISEERKTEYIVRIFRISDSQKSRDLEQLHYCGWPDHSVPRNIEGFINFIKVVNKKRNEADIPVLVHCSAGVGRTGCFIAMETALGKLRNSEAVDMVEIVTEMRRHRGLLIQTPVQFRFVCEAVVKAFDEQLYQ